MKNNVDVFLKKASKVFSRKGIYPFLKQEFSEIKPGANVFLIGAGGSINELLRQYAKQENFRVTSFDIDQTKSPDILGDICTYKFSQYELFDYVVVSEVLEHIHSPHLAINQIYRILKVNGKLILTVPFIFPIHERPVDYYRYTKYGLEFLLREFKDIRIEERNSWAEAINVLTVRLIMEKHITTRFAASFFIGLAYLRMPLIMLTAKIIPTDFMTTGYLVTARK
ncbi:MAG: methyltransferase domain-containing protein [Coleofasciculus sp. C1-SOL-03]|jgi:SAM-dependent methyltransferase|uniref:class I SAM-dependent methyltransferase n=1 Tax=Coleofasciculus sp. C1-SOL-03 TaxID=3069522 RepID=UPI0032F3CFA8